MESYLKNKSNLKALDKMAMTLYVAITILAELLLLVYTLLILIGVGRYDFGAGLFALIGIIAAMIVIAVTAIAWLVTALMLRDVARARGANGVGLLLVGLFASPLVLGLYILALPPLSPQAQAPIVVGRDD